MVFLPLSTIRNSHTPLMRRRSFLPSPLTRNTLRPPTVFSLYTTTTQTMTGTDTTVYLQKTSQAITGFTIDVFSDGEFVSGDTVVGLSGLTVTATHHGDVGGPFEADGVSFDNAQKTTVTFSDPLGQLAGQTDVALFKHSVVNNNLAHRLTTAEHAVVFRDCTTLGSLNFSVQTEAARQPFVYTVTYAMISSFDYVVETETVEVTATLTKTAGEYARSFMLNFWYKTASMNTPTVSTTLNYALVGPAIGTPPSGYDSGITFAYNNGGGVEDLGASSVEVCTFAIAPIGPAYELAATDYELRFISFVPYDDELPVQIVPLIYGATFYYTEPYVTTMATQLDASSVSLRLTLNRHPLVAMRGLREVTLKLLSPESSTNLVFNYVFYYVPPKHKSQ